ncbi:MAG: sodium-dependent transporter [Evtepia sp.]|uniref:sodium-dependent transporter n=1 Tax=Evtepia sp. TaxID=2773933 RepID=UPI002A755AE9|nr:sodium-dependent transporter [Evtepia sp.]MDY3014030.1 sodium-dependent transporter [Evtepia sp.]
MERERLGSRLGFILLSAGCAIGIGNVWKFPYMVGQNGGGAFVLLYLFFLLIMGIPVMTIEFSLGRASQKSPVRLYQALAPKGTYWKIHGYVSMAGNYILMMFYTAVAGWMIQYFFATASGRFEGLNVEQVGKVYEEICANPVGMVGFTSFVVVLGFFICSFSLQKGLEKVSKFMMLALLAIMVILAINSFTMEGAKEGLTFYLKPDLNKMQEVGIGNVIVGAMTQAFFTLSLGMGSMAIFGSYINKERSLLGESVNVAVLDTFVALVSGLIIFPACFTYNVEAGAGPSLIFVTLPNVFNHMPMGTLWGSLFFVFMTFAALTTVLAVFETILACCMDLFGWSRKKACFINCLIMLVLALPCALGFNLLSGINPMGGTSTFMDLEDFLVSNIILPVGSLVFLLFVVTKKGWGWKNFTDEANAGKGLKVKDWMKGYMTYILPFLFLAIFLIGLITYFK